MNRGPLCLLACGDAVPLGRNLAEHLGTVLCPSHDVWFACAEGKHVIDGNIRGSDAYILQRALGDASLDAHGVWSPYDRMMMLLHAVDAARHADVDRITVVLPYLPGTRQDKRKDHVREGVSTGLFARLFAAAGADRLVTLEPHNEAVLGCYDPGECHMEAVSVSRPFARFLAGIGWKPDVVASTDVGGLERARVFAQQLEAGIVALSKERDYSAQGRISNTTVVGDVAGKDVLVVDDIIDTAGSVVSAVEALWDAGAKGISVAAVHLVMSDPAWERMQGLATVAEARGTPLRFAGTNSIVHCQPGLPMAVFDLQPLLASVIRSINSRGSVRALE